VISLLTWASVGLALGTLAARRRSVAIGLMALQSALLGVAALGLLPGRSPDFAAATAVLAMKALGLAALLGWTVRRTRESTPVRSDLGPLARIAVSLVMVLAVNLLLPAIPSLGSTAQRGAVSLVCLGMSTVVLRRATILQLVGILVAENGLALAAISLRGGMPLVIELGAVFDLTVVVSVAIAFHHRIHSLLGSGDSTLLSELHD